MVREELGELAEAAAGHLRWLQEEGLAIFRQPAAAASAPMASPDLQECLPVLAPSDAVDDPDGGPEEGFKRPPTDSCLEAVREDLGDCQRCKLSAGRTQIVFGRGNPKAALMFVGEGPGQEEDRQGMPFVGRAGALLTKMISAMGLSQEEVYIANIIKCRPPNNRNPQPDEIAACRPFLDRQIAVIGPRVICALGTFAAQTLLQSERRISELRGRFFDFQGAKILPTFHPAYLLRSPEKKALAWEDLQKIMAELNLPPRGRG